MTYYFPSLNDRTNLSNSTLVLTADCAVGATTKPGNQLSLIFFLSLDSTQTTFPKSFLSISVESFSFLVNQITVINYTYCIKKYIDYMNV